MSSTFYGNRRIFETKFNAFDSSPCKNMQSESEPFRQYAATMLRPRSRSCLRRSFSLKIKSRKNLSIGKKSDLSKKQLDNTKASASITKAYNSEEDKTTGRGEVQSPIHQVQFGSILQQKSIDESTVFHADLNIYVHGYCGAGKSTLVHQLVDVFQATDIFDVGKEHRNEIYINTSQASYHIKEIDVLYKGSFKEADIHLIVFAADDMVSLRYAMDRVTFLKCKYRIQSQILLVANTRDVMRRQLNCERDVKLITEKFNCRFLRLTGVLIKDTAIFKEALNIDFTNRDGTCCTSNKNVVLRRIFSCFFSRKE